MDCVWSGRRRPRQACYARTRPRRHHRHDADRYCGIDGRRTHRPSDGVFAIALTLLVLDLRLPPLAGHWASALGQALAADAPRFVAFVISFEVIGIFWLAHLRLFSVIARYDRGLAFINLLFLMSI